MDIRSFDAQDECCGDKAVLKVDQEKEVLLRGSNEFFSTFG